jgi:hypothetical protein
MINISSAAHINTLSLSGHFLPFFHLARIHKTQGEIWCEIIFFSIKSPCVKYISTMELSFSIRSEETYLNYINLSSGRKNYK